MKPLAVIKHFVSSPLTDKDTSYYTAFSKQPHFDNQFLFISAEFISYMVQDENKFEHKPPPIEHTSPVRNTPKNILVFYKIVLFAILHT